MAEYLVPRVRKVPQEAVTLTGGIRPTYIQYLTKPKAYKQILEVGNTPCCRLTQHLRESSHAGQDALAPGDTPGAVCTGPCPCHHTLQQQQPQPFVLHAV